MKQVVKYKVVIVWLLLAVFVTPYVAKPIHTCHHGSAYSECTHSLCDCDNCPVCHFTLPFFIEAETPAFSSLRGFTALVSAIYQEKNCISDIPSHHLRGPPHI
ncbi:MAG: hypothetical protein LBT78_00530 [Tannerella sp.]|nr:hypothetical protein [Tannerella sp.]